MANGNIQAKRKRDDQRSYAKSDWHSTTRQAERDAVRMGWARHVLAEEDTYPSTHSSARVRLAEFILASVQNEQP